MKLSIGSKVEIETPQEIIEGFVKRIVRNSNFQPKQCTSSDFEEPPRYIDGPLEFGDTLIDLQTLKVQKNRAASSSKAVEDKYPAFSKEEQSILLSVIHQAVVNHPITLSRILSVIRQVSEASDLGLT